MSRIRQSDEENYPRIPLTEFVYLIPKNKFIYLPTGRPWVKGGVNVVFGLVEGMRATDWLKIHRAVMVVPEWRQP